MPAAARVADVTNHGGAMAGPGSSKVIIGKMPAAVATDTHVCPIPAPAHVPTVGPFPVGSSKVFLEKKPALRAGDACPCGASAAVGYSKVIIN